MEHFDEILLEQYFTYINMSEDARNNCINILLHTKDICESEMNINGKNPNKYDLLTLHLINSDGLIKFNGAIYNESENRIIEGAILKRNNKVFVDTSVYRLNDCLSEEGKEYSVSDLFIFKNNKIIRRTSYEDGRYFEDEISLMSNEEVIEYLQNKVEGMKRRG